MPLKKRIVHFKTIPRKPGTELQISENVEPNYSRCIDRDLFAKGIIADFLGKNSGFFVTLPRGTRIMNCLKKLIMENISKKFGFQEYFLPKLVNREILKTAKIAGKWDDYLFSVKPYSAKKGFKEEYIMDPLQCTPLYAFFREEEIKEENLPIKAVDLSGPTYRNEYREKLRPSVKQREFHRIEFVYLGYKKDIASLREELLREMENVCFKLNIPFRRVVGSGCYEVTSNLAESAESLEEIPVIDLEMLVSGGSGTKSKKTEYLEVAGASILKDQHIKRFGIKANSGKKLWSGCFGIGLERFAYAFLSNNGFEQKNWPKSFKKYLEK